METITSEITTTPIHIDTKYTHYTSDQLLFPDPGFSEYTVHTKSRYGNMHVFRNDGMIGFSIQAYGEYGQYEINLLNHVIDSNSIVYDIGSNIGFHSLGLSEKAKHVYAFEPNSKNYKLCKLNTKFNNKISLYNVACSNFNGTGYIEDIDLSQPNNYGEVHVSSEGIETEFVKLDDFIANNNIPVPHVIKIDVEGHEWEVLQGLDQTIRTHLPVILYEHQHGDYLPNIYDYLTELGYTIYWFPCANYNPMNFKGNTNNYFMPNSGVVNALALPKTLDVKTSLPVKTHRDQTFQEAVELAFKANAQKN